MSSSSSSTTSSYDSNRLETLQEENGNLKKYIKQLEREKVDLKASVYQLSYLFNSCVYEMKKCGVAIDEEAFPVSRSFVPATPKPKEKSSYADELRASATATAAVTRSDQPLGNKFSLKGHTGSVYSVRFSPCGKLLASGSFDKTVRVWDFAKKQNVLTFDEHKLNVSDVVWSADGTTLASGSYDRTLKTFDITTGKLNDTFETTGFVQSLIFAEDNPNIVYAACTHKQIVGFDRRSGSQTFVFENDSMVNSITSLAGGSQLVSGDGNGMLKLWSTHSGKCMHSFQNGPGGKPISHVHSSSLRNGTREDNDPNLVAVNSFDNTLRVYDAGKIIAGEWDLKCELQSHKNKNWPIRSSFYWEPAVAHSLNRGGTREPLIATGSTDTMVYVFNVSNGPEPVEESVNDEVDGFTSDPTRKMQKLAGHKDIVYCVSFHPQEYYLASASADCSIKIWGPP